MKDQNKISDPLEDLLDRVSDYELDKERKEKYTRLKTEALRKRKSRKIWMISSLAAASMITIAIILNLNPSELRSKDLYNDFFKPHNFQIEYRGTIDPRESFATAVKLFEEDKLAQSELIVNDLLNQDKNNPDILLLKSQILMLEGNYNPALDFLNQLMVHGGSYERTGLWYSSLSFLAIENYSDCGRSLDRLLSFDSSDYEKQARKLRRKVKKSQGSGRTAQNTSKFEVLRLMGGNNSIINLASKVFLLLPQNIVSET